MTPQPDRFPHVRRALAEHPWAMLESAYEAMVEIVERRAAGVRLSDEEIEARIGAARRAPRSSAAPGAIAVLPLFGVISHRIGMFDDISGGTSVEAWGRDFQAAVDDPNVTAILIDVNSPGGSVYGVEELADRIFAARGTKPIVAISNALTASAAYFLASQADELVVIPSGEVGSIGVIAVHDDWSGATEKMGVRRTYVTAGRYKAEGNGTEPLSDEARTFLQSRVDDYYGAFVKAVARGRGTSQKNVRENYGEGRVYGAAKALEVGMVDRVATFEETVARVAARQEKPRARAESEGVVIDNQAPEIDRDRLALQVAVAAAERRA